MHVRLHCCNVLVFGCNRLITVELSVCYNALCVVYDSLLLGIVQHVLMWPLCSVFLYLLFHCNPVVMGTFHIPLEHTALFGACAVIQNKSELMLGEFWYFPVAESRSQTECSVFGRKMYFTFFLSLPHK